MHVCMHECVSRFPLRGCASGFVSVETTAFIFAGVCERICLSAGGATCSLNSILYSYICTSAGVCERFCVSAPTTTTMTGTTATTTTTMSHARLCIDIYI